MNFKDIRNFRGKIFCLFVFIIQGTEFNFNKSGVGKKINSATK